MTPLLSSSASIGHSFSILFGRERPADADRCDEPDYFRDLNLDRVVAELVGDDPLAIRSFFHYRLRDPKLAQMRAEVFADLDRQPVLSALQGFSRSLGLVRTQTEGATKIHHGLRRQRWFLLVAERYCNAVDAISRHLASEDSTPRATALLEAAEHLAAYRATNEFVALRQAVDELQARFRDVVFNTFIAGGRVTVGPHDDEPDYRSEVVELFSRWRQDGSHEPEWREHRRRLVEPGSRRKPPDRRIDRVYTQPRRSPQRFEADADPIRERIIELAARLEPRLFADLAAFCETFTGYLDDEVMSFHRELQFYLNYVELTDRLRRSGLELTSAQLQSCDRLRAQGTYDLALALHLTPSDDAHQEGSGPRGKADTGVVPNDVELVENEKILVVTGPNQGGKTTLARTVGQLHHLAALGCPVPGRQVSLRLPDKLFTHFEREEVETVREGKLGDDLRRMHDILTNATDRSVVILNEIFSSTTAADAADLGAMVLERVHNVGATCVCVTFLDELSRLNEETVSMVATVDPDDPSRRTFVLERRRADGRSYASAVAALHGLTYDALRERIDR